MLAAYSFCSSNDPLRPFLGLGSVLSVDALDVTWADGTREAFPCPALTARWSSYKGRATHSALREASVAR